MKKKFVPLIFMLSRYTFYGLVCQCFTLTVVFASRVDAQNIMSVRDVMVNIEFKGENLEKAFSKIESATQFTITYYKEDIDKSIRIHLPAENQSLGSLLLRISEMTGLAFKQVNSNINVRKINKNENGGHRLEVIIQTRNVTGKVTSQEDGEGLPGVNVIEKGTSNGTVTNVEGVYSLGVSEGATLVFSSIGYTREEVEVGNRSVIDLSMRQDIRQLEELVVIGYGTMKKANLTGAVSMATSERLENRPIASTGHGLVGVIPNLNVSIRSGDPTRRATYNIRGFESINGGSPLILVDGVPMELDMINPNDIESVNVLKDASSAAVYGGRAAFGVILVETKKGKEGLNISLSSETSLSKPIMHVDLITDSYEYNLLRNAVYADVGRVWINDTRMAMLKKYYDDPTPENEWTVLNGQLYYNGNTDFLGYMLTDFAPQQKYDLSVSGSTSKTSFYTSFGYLDKKGYLKNKNANLDYDRFNILMKADFKLTEWFSLDPKIAINVESNSEPHHYAGDRALNTIVRLNPDTPLKFPDLPYYLEPGDRDQFEQYIGMYFDGARNAPFAHLGGRDLFNTYDVWLTQGATLNPLKGLRIRSDFSYQVYNRMEEAQQTEIPMVTTNLSDFRIVYAQSKPTYIRNRSDFNRYYVYNTYGEYTLDKFTNHYFKVMAGFNQEWGRNSYIMARANDLATPTVRDLSATTGDQVTDGGKSHMSLRGAFYRVNYIFRDKYLFETNGRYDLTSRFPQDSRMGFFPSVSMAWRISNENFMNITNNWLSNLLIRGSYGSLGNQLLGSNYYPYISTMGMGLRPHIFSSGQVPYVSPPGLVSSELTWETVSTRNIGLDLAFLDQRLEINLDAYKRETKNMLMRKSYPVILGTDAPDANAADLKTTGWEMNLIWRDRIGKNWNYRLNLALSDNQAEITKYENPTGNINDYYVGKKIGEIWGYETIGLFQSDDEVAKAPSQIAIFNGIWQAGDIQYADLNGDGVISPGGNTLENPGDRRIIGNSSARYSFGINPDISYKNISLNLFFQGLFRDHYPGTGSHTAFWPFNTDGFEKWWIKESWSEDNRDAYFPRPRFMRVTNNTKNFTPQTRFLQNASYIRLKNVTINYSLPQDLISKVGLSRAQIYLSGFNVWEYSKIHKPLDPEYVFTTAQEYFMQRTYALGVRVTF